MFKAGKTAALIAFIAVFTGGVFVLEVVQGWTKRTSPSRPHKYSVERRMARQRAADNRRQDATEEEQSDANEHHSLMSRALHRANRHWHPSNPNHYQHKKGDSPS